MDLHPEWISPLLHLLNYGFKAIRWLHARRNAQQGYQPRRTSSPDGRRRRRSGRQRCHNNRP